MLKLLQHKFGHPVSARALIPLVLCSGLLSACQITDVLNESAISSSQPQAQANPPINSNERYTYEQAARRDKYASIARAQHPSILSAYGGIYNDPKVERMVARVVGQLGFVPEDPDQTFQITILDSPSVNAFALPGGYLYVTRGLLALAKDSSELAAVIAHEMAHVTARHGILRQQKQAEQDLANQVAAQVIDDDLSRRAANVRSRLNLAQFSRNQELQADAIGIKMIGNAGFDPFAAARFQGAMNAYTGLNSVTGAANPGLDFLATHPSGRQRVELAKRHARQFGAPGIGARGQVAYLNGIDGLLFGDSASDGYVRGRHFYHPEAGITFSVPQGFVIDNGKDAVVASGPGEVVIGLDGLSGDDIPSLNDYLNSGWVNGLDQSSIRHETINGLPAIQAQARAGGKGFHITLIRVDSTIYRLLTTAPGTPDEISRIADEVARSFRLVSKQEITNLKPLRVRVVTVKAGDNQDTMIARMRGVGRKAELFRTINGLARGEALTVGNRVKIITDQ